MKHLKIYEDYGFERPDVHKDDDLFDEIVKELGSEIETPVGQVDDDNKDAWNRWHFWQRNDSTGNNTTTIKWVYKEKIKMKNYWDDKPTEKEIRLEKTIYNPEKITSSIKKDEIKFYVGDHWQDKLDVSEEKLKNFFNKLEIKYKVSFDKRKLDIDVKKKIATFDALKKREEERISKTSQKFGI
jgi:hypothetical protein